ncbi:unnamed protein product [Chrysoparadoxa australica]
MRKRVTPRGQSAGGKKKRIKIEDTELGDFSITLALWEKETSNYCETCGRGGLLLSCSFCSCVYHLRCLDPPLKELPSSPEWMCPKCLATVKQQRRKKLELRNGKCAARSPVGAEMRYRGVKGEGGSHWRAMYRMGARSVDLGLFSSAIAAARAHDAHARKQRGGAAVLNFPVDESSSHSHSTSGAVQGAVLGVMRSCGEWRASIKWGNRRKHLGFFPSIGKAAEAYNSAAVYYLGPSAELNCPCGEESERRKGDEDAGPAPVQVPRNKLFQQALRPGLKGLMLEASKSNDGASSATLERRQRQMKGEYCEPLVGEEVQVTNMPSAEDWDQSADASDDFGGYGSMVFDGNAAVDILLEVYLASVPPAAKEHALQVLHGKHYNASSAQEALQLLWGGGPKTRASSRAGGGRERREAYARGYSKLDVSKATEAFMVHGRDLAAAKEALGWNWRRVVDFYYTTWKFSAGYQIWKSARHNAALQPPLDLKGLKAGTCSPTLPTGEGMRWRGSRLRTLKADA